MALHIFSHHRHPMVIINNYNPIIICLTTAGASSLAGDDSVVMVSPEAEEEQSSLAPHVRELFSPSPTSPAVSVICVGRTLCTCVLSRWCVG